METFQLCLSSFGAIAVPIFSYLKYKDQSKFRRIQELANQNEQKALAHETRIAVLELEVVECHTAKDAMIQNHRQLNEFFTDKVIRLERERDVVLSDLRIAQNRVIELQDRIQEIRKPR